MKNALTRKLMAAAAALIVLASMAGCTARPQTETDQPQPAVSASDSVSDADVSGSDVSGSDVSGSDVSGSDAPVVDDAADADSVIEAYFAAFNSGDAGKLAELTCSPAMVSFLKSNGYSTDFVKMNYADTIKQLQAQNGGSFDLRYEYILNDADTTLPDVLKSELNELSAGSGDKVQMVRVYQVTMKLVEEVSASDVSGSDVQVLEQYEDVMFAYKYDGTWYVFSN